MFRREIRKHIFCMLFLKEFHEGEDLSEQLTLYLDDIEDKSEQETDYFKTKTHDVLAHLNEIDARIRKNSEGWRLERMGKVDLSILRLAVYEIFYEEGVPTKVAINEAVELAKEFGEERSASFINGLLGKIERNRDGDDGTSI